MITADILLDGLFAAIAAIGFGAVSDPPMRAFPRIALLAAMGHALRFCLMHYFSVDIATASLFASISIGFGSLWLGHPLPDDGPLHPRPAADGSRHLCLQDRLFAHHVPAIAQRPGGGVAIHAAVLPQRHRIAERDRAAGSGGYAAHLRIQPPGILAHAAPQAYRQITIHGNLLEHHRLL